MALRRLKSGAARSRYPAGRRFAIVAASLLAACSLYAETIEPEGWRRLGAPVWRFDPTGTEAGPDTAGSFLVSEAQYADFVLTVEFWVEAETNSGVFIRCGEVANVDDVNPFDCYEINIFDDHPQQENRTGAIVMQVPPVAQVDTVGQWNRLEIRARGPVLKVSVNGTRTAVLNDARSSAGPVALQYGGSGLVRFRKLAIDSE